MKKYKIYTTSNYFIVEGENGVHYGLKKDVFVIKNNNNRLFYTIKNVEGISELGLNLSQIKKQNGDDYTQQEWETFYTQNTGNFSSGSASIDPQILDALEQANSPSSSNVFATLADLGGLSSIVFVEELSDFPAPSSGVITLAADTTYYLAADIDLEGSRLVGGSNTCILGQSSENSILTSTGLGAGVPLLSSIYTTPIRHITIRDVDTAIEFDATSNPVDSALDWTGVNFLNVPNVGLVKNCTNFIYDKGAFLNSKELKFDGTIGTVALNNSLFIPDGAAGACVELLATTVITRRFRIIYSSISAFGSSVGINVSESATIPNENYILDTVNFSGGGAYLQGVTNNDNKALFSNCVGIDNTFEAFSSYAEGESTPTVITTTGAYVKANIATTEGSFVGRFTHTANRATYIGSKTRTFTVQAIMTIISTSNADNVAMKIYKNGVAIPGTRSIDATRTIFGDNAAVNMKSITVTQLETGDYIEIYIANLSDTSNITVTDLSKIIS